jgi:phosphopantetheinyl transferase
MWILQESIDETCSIGVWQIEEAASFFLQSPAINQERFTQITHPQKQLEYLASRYVAGLLSGENDKALILNNSDRSPYFAHLPYSLSISHCCDYVAIAIDKKGRKIGIDIERSSDKINRIATRFMEEQELHPNFATNPALAKCLCWSIKESVFKCLPVPGINFKAQMKIEQWDENSALTMVKHPNYTGTIKSNYRLLNKSIDLVLAFSVQ